MRTLGLCYYKALQEVDPSESNLITAYFNLQQLYPTLLQTAFLPNNAVGMLIEGVQDISMLTAA